ncbi:hypothetical protein GLOIN_2v1844088 [Rhizophagus irregularis DAOM 181602=DAOM 197198]|uniref:Uncharacterized protein n=1 Tax=Rhizophagus irregularis (strain DAOM 181602 / DAOM 197198 / MUCL 43194) TaxID=747089 RepID=A0A2P4PMF4_RHIID|nr:hypothetical protein GLOIN_2v1844088 [Rhizophagus irregularis DAOM 181602=DAOM 197198]POG66568.1 hypothetical protein GLOIN_2v1844088 [Rhizophagus irregularis DAOM 181602=DAOM 197198]|eukprot:XP_025173434.1 hypothetical protein GLOIN_2v1844088 [Rhizophagus irregularis DAOM 181602=DAOM 197198]
MVKEKKKKYKIGTCFGCQKFLYCGINLEKDICKCKKTVKPTRTNRTVQVKTAYPRMFNPTSSNHKQFNFIKSKNECFQYGYDFKKNIQLSFCSTCNSSYQRLSSKNSNSSNKSNLTEGTENTEEKETGGTKGTDIAKIIDLEATSSEISTTIIQSESKYNNSETENESDAELELEVNYKLVIKQADGTVLPAKNYSVTISELDEFLFAIQNNITALLKDNEINANDYNVSFKSEKAQGAGTLLVDVCDFENFKSEYIKLAAAKKVVLILITMKKKEKLVKRKKKESNSDNEEAICDESIPKTNNNNKVPKISDIFILDQRIAKNVTELRKETWCPMHNRHCLKDCESHTEISNMMFSTWATEMLNGLATVKEPPTHPSFAYTHPPKNRSQSIIPQFSNNIQDSINPFFSNILQALVTPHFFQPPQSQQSFQQPPLQPSFQQTSSHPSSQQTIPSMAEFFHQIDEIEKTEDYYFKFLEGFEKQRIKVKHLNKLNDAQFEACGVIAIGDVETISEAAQNYK